MKKISISFRPFRKTRKSKLIRLLFFSVATKYTENGTEEVKYKRSSFHSSKTKFKLDYRTAFLMPYENSRENFVFQKETGLTLACTCMASAFGIGRSLLILFMRLIIERAFTEIAQSYHFT